MEVFRPSNGPLIVRDNLAAGLGESADVFRKSRPETRAGYRFGQLSYNSFFARHNPHPSRVRHLKGLLDVPICSVNDDGSVSNPRYSRPQFPPSNHDDIKLQSRYYNVPVHSINVNSQRHPINTITGLQYFQGTPLNMRIFREKAVPRMGMVPVTEGWRDELRALTEALGVAPPAANQPQLNGVVGTPGKPQGTPGGGGGMRPRTSQYSAETGRLIPPPSRAMSRGPSRGSSRGGTRGGTAGQLGAPAGSTLQHIVEDPDLEGQILQMLCQILQTDDISAVQAWLVNGSTREKEQVLNMIRATLDNTDQYYKHDPSNASGNHGNQAGGMHHRAVEEMGRTLGSGSDVDRLTLNGDEPRPRTTGGVPGEEGPAAAWNTKRPATAPYKPPSPIHNTDDTCPPVLPDIFKAPNTPGGIRTSASRQGTPQQHGAAPRTPSIKYTRAVVPSAGGGGGAGGLVVKPSGQDEKLQAILEDKDKVWDPLASVAVKQ